MTRDIHFTVDWAVISDPYDLVDYKIFIGCWIEIASMLLNGFLI